MVLDQNKNLYALVIVELDTKFKQVYPCASLDALPVARALYQHFCTFGMFHTVASDPARVFIGDAVKQLMKWFSARHKVSLTSRHESCGVEGSNKLVRKLLAELAVDERIKNRWSDVTVLPAVVMELNNFPSSETGGYSPNQLKYGTLQAQKMFLPTHVGTPEVPWSKFIDIVDADLRTVRELSEKFQLELAAARRKDKPFTQLVEGDLVLKMARQEGEQFREHKFASMYLGPFEVVTQEESNITLLHMATRESEVVEISRLKPFFGSREQAFELAKFDKDQYSVVSIQYYVGNPMVRKSMAFNITFEDGVTKMRFWDRDLDSNQVYRDFCSVHPPLFPLRFSKAESLKQIKKLNSMELFLYKPGDYVFLDLHFYDGDNSVWYDSCEKLTPHKTYVSRIQFTEWNVIKNKPDKTKIRAHDFSYDKRVAGFNQILLDGWDIFAFVIPRYDPDTMVYLDYELMQSSYFSGSQKNPALVVKE